MMTRFPELGRTKTRLIPALDADRAAALHWCLIVRTLAVGFHWADTHDCDVEVRFAGGDELQFRVQFGLRAVGVCILRNFSNLVKVSQSGR